MVRRLRPVCYNGDHLWLSAACREFHRCNTRLEAPWPARQSDPGKRMAKWLIILGATLLLMGVILQFAPWLFAWFGKLPGDINIESGAVKVFIPITSMLIVSLLLTLLLNLLNR